MPKQRRVPKKQWKALVGGDTILEVPVDPRHQIGTADIYGDAQCPPLPFCEARLRIPGAQDYHPICAKYYDSDPTPFLELLEKCTFNNPGYNNVIASHGIFEDGSKKVMTFERVSCTLRRFLTESQESLKKTPNMTPILEATNLSNVLIRLIRDTGKGMRQIHSVNEVHGKISLDDIFVVIDDLRDPSDPFYATAKLFLPDHEKGKLGAIDRFLLNSQKRDWMRLGNLVEEIQRVINLPTNLELVQLANKLKGSSIFSVESLLSEPALWLSHQRHYLFCEVAASLKHKYFRGPECSNFRWTAKLRFAIDNGGGGNATIYDNYDGFITFVRGLLRHFDRSQNNVIRNHYHDQETCLRMIQLDFPDILTRIVDFAKDNVDSNKVLDAALKDIADQL